MVDRDAWTEPGAHPVAPGVHRIPLPLPNDGLKAVNVYAIEDGDGLVLVDSGWSIPVARELLEQAVKALDASLADVHRFLITHVHRDHYTQAVMIRRDLGTPIELGHEEGPSLEVLRGVGREPMAPQMAQLRAHGADDVARGLADAIASSDEEHDRTVWEDPDGWLGDGDLTLDGGRHLDVVETPGHTRGHVVFHDTGASLLFAGDHVLPTITPSIGFEAVLVHNPLGDFLASLAKVRQRPDASLLPAHGPVAPSVHARVDELVAHHGRRLDETAAAIDEGATTAYEAAHILRWTRRGRAFAALDVFNQMMATGETAAHLDLLAAQGRLTRTDDAGKVRYLPA
jgi:glyoxylase-like metal-dependent hydrolase (beta-lactamase superfamily II)